MGMLLERIARNWKLIKSFEGKKVRGKRSYLKKFYEIRNRLEQTLNADVIVREVDRTVYVVDRNVPYKTGVKYPLYRIEEGKLLICEKTAELVENADNYILQQRERYDELIESFKDFLEKFNQVSRDYLIRQENTEVLSSDLRKLAYILSPKNSGV